MPGSGDNFMHDNVEKINPADDEQNPPDNAKDKGSEQEVKYSDNYTENYSSVKQNTA